MSEYNYDIVVLGAGPGGYEAAIRCAQYGKNTALVEARDLGGTCLNRGCIPTKALLHGAEVYQSALNAASCGVTTGEVGFDFAKLAEYKDSVVAGLRKGIAGLEKAHGVKVINGFGKLVDEHTLDVDGEKITFDKLILATGSAPARPPIPGIDGENVVTSDEVLSMTELPDSFVIIGGGVIGIEFATLFASLGKPVTVIEMMPSILPGVDADIVKMLSTRVLKPAPSSPRSCTSRGSSPLSVLILSISDTMVCNWYKAFNFSSTVNSLGSFFASLAIVFLTNI